MYMYTGIIAHSRRMWQGLDLSSRSDLKAKSQPIDCFADFSRRRQWITSGSWRPVLVSGLGSWVGYWVGGCAHSSELTWLHDWHCMRWTTTNATTKRVQGIIWESAARTFASTNCSSQSNKIPYKYIHIIYIVCLLTFKILELIRSRDPDLRKAPIWFLFSQLYDSSRVNLFSWPSNTSVQLHPVKGLT